jgi:hypothetical protein
MKTLRTAATLVMIVGLGALHKVEAQDLALSVRLRNDARVSAEVANDAEAAVARVYAKAGVAVTWVPARANLTIIVLGRAQAIALGQASDAMGFAPGSDTGRVHIAYILMHRVDEIAAGYHAEKAIVLGAAIAHEIGHLLLPRNSHSKRGIMRAVWNQADFRNAKRDELIFTADQVAQIRSELVARGN